MFESSTSRELVFLVTLYNKQENVGILTKLSREKTYASMRNIVYKMLFILILQSTTKSNIFITWKIVSLTRLRCINITLLETLDKCFYFSFFTTSFFFVYILLSRDNFWILLKKMNFHRSSELCWEIYNKRSFRRSILWKYSCFRYSDFLFGSFSGL